MVTGSLSVVFFCVPTSGSEYSGSRPGTGGLDQWSRQQGDSAVGQDVLSESSSIQMYNIGVERDACWGIKKLTQFLKNTMPHQAEVYQSTCLCLLLGKLHVNKQSKRNMKMLL